MKPEDIRRLQRHDRQQDGGPLEPTVPRASMTDEDARRRFPIDTRMTSMPAMSAVAWQAVRYFNDPPRYFLLAGSPVRIAGGTNGEAVTAQDLTVDMLRGISARTAFWHKYSERQGEIEQFPLEPVMRDMLADPEPPLPRLARIVQAPVCAPDGTITYAPGYDAATGIYNAGPAVEPAPADPTPAQVAAARGFLLDELLGDFPFTGDAERAHALSLLLNPFLRDLIDGPTPLYLIEAPSAGTGKGLLAHMLTLPALGDPPILLPPATNEEETRKRLTSTLLQLPEAVLLDNVTKSIDSPSLAAALTATMWTDRLLGRSETRSVRIRATWIATANNPSMSREIARRIVRIRMDAQAERPEERSTFRHRHLARWAADHRRELIGAALTLVQAWLAAGAPMGDHVLGSFDVWAQVHGGVLDVAGVPGFLANRKETRAAVSDEDVAVAQLVERWWALKGGAVVPSKDLYEIARDLGDFPMGRASTDNGMRVSFGRLLGRHRGKVYGPLRILQAEMGSNNNHYQLVPAKPPD